MNGLTQFELAAILGREPEVSSTGNFAGQMSAAVEALEDMLGFKLGGEAGESRIYAANSGFRSLVVDPFIFMPETMRVTHSGEPVTDFRVRLGDDYNADFFNVIELPDPMRKGFYSVEAAWGFGNDLPFALKRLIAGLYEAMEGGRSYSQGAVKSETVLSHSVTYDTSQSPVERFKLENAELLSKYAAFSKRGIAMRESGGCL